MKNKVLFITLSVLLVISFGYGIITTIAISQLRNEKNNFTISITDQQPIVAPALSVMRSLGMVGYTDRFIEKDKDSADIYFEFASGKTVKAVVVSGDDKWELLYLSNDDKVYYWLDDSVSSYGKITKWEN